MLKNKIFGFGPIRISHTHTLFTCIFLKWNLAGYNPANWKFPGLKPGPESFPIKFELLRCDYVGFTLRISDHTALAFNFKRQVQAAHPSLITLRNDGPNFHLTDNISPIRSNCFFFYFPLNRRKKKLKAL